MVRKKKDFSSVSKDKQECGWCMCRQDPLIIPLSPPQTNMFEVQVAKCVPQAISILHAIDISHFSTHTLSIWRGEKNSPCEELAIFLPVCPLGANKKEKAWVLSSYCLCPPAPHHFSSPLPSSLQTWADFSGLHNETLCWRQPESIKWQLSGNFKHSTSQ